MFDRQKYKQFAKIQLKDRMGIPVLTTFITLAIILACTIPISLSSSNSIDYNSLNTADIEELIGSLSTIYANLLRSDFLTTLVALIETVLIYGSINMYLKMSKSPEPVSFNDFTDGLAEFGRAILAYLWQLLWLTLWTMLFIIPGIIKSYEYKMTYYLACEYKNISVIDALNISKKITRGHKFDLFILDLSFIGWNLLGMISCGVGFLWIIPYIKMTEINAYHAILKEAIEEGRLNPEELKYSEEEDEKEDSSKSSDSTNKFIEQEDTNDNESTSSFDSDSETSDNNASDDYENSDTSDESDDNYKNEREE
ncbi:MAG: DUF975 family protein [Treponema sp.]|nr:DUF975 family protein [Treponema sp.]